MDSLKPILTVNPPINCLKIILGYCFCFTSLMIINVSPVKADTAFGSGPLFVHMIEHMASSENNFSCTVYFLEQYQLSEDAKCKQTNDFIKYNFDRKHIDLDDKKYIGILLERMLRVLIRNGAIASSLRPEGE